MVNLNCGQGPFSVSIQCDGENMDEYAVNPISATRQQCYIASEENKPFSITVETPPTRPWQFDHVAEFYLDGVYIVGKVLRRTHKPLYKMTVSGAMVSAALEKPFMFGRLEMREEDALDSSVSLTQRSLTDLGTIRVLLRACEVMEETLRPAVESTKDYTLPGDAPISEKSKKAGAHASKLGAVRSAVPVPTVSTNPVPGIESQDVVYHYAPFDLLAARGIIPAGTKPRKPKSSETSTATTSSSSEPSSSKESTASTARAKVKAEAEAEGSTRINNPKKRSSSSVIDLTVSSDEEGGAGGKGKGKGKNKRTKVKREHAESKLIVLSDSD